jgi:hypothetical protein
MKKYSLHIALLLLLPTVGYAQILPSFGGERAGLSALSFLKNDISPRSAAMGGTTVSLAGDAYSIYHNVAGLADNEGNSFALTSAFLGAGINQSFVSGIFPFKSGTSALGISINTLNSGAIEERTEFQPEGTGRMIYVNNTAFGLSFAQQLSANFSLGGTLRYIYENLADFTNHTINVDVGFLYKTDFKDLHFAVLVRNFGGNSSLTGTFLASNYNRTSGTTLESNTFPNVFSLGISMIPWKNERHSLVTAFQLNHPNDNAENYRLGVEYSYLELLFVRTGLKINVTGQSLPTLGLGVRMMLGQHPLYFDYSALPTDYVGVQHLVGLRFSVNKIESR